MTTAPAQVPADLHELICACQLPPPAERRAIRRRARVSMQTVADLVGADLMSISRWERGLHHPQRRYITAYKRVLEVLAQHPEPQK